MQPSLSELLDALARAMGVSPPALGEIEWLFELPPSPWFHEVLAALIAAEPTDWRDVPARDFGMYCLWPFMTDVLPGAVHTERGSRTSLTVTALGARAVVESVGPGAERYRIESTAPKFEERNGYWLSDRGVVRLQAGTPIPDGEERDGYWIPDGAHDPNPELLGRWARDTSMLLHAQEEVDVVLLNPSLVPPLLELAADPTVVKADYILSAMDHYLIHDALRDGPVHRVGREVALRSQGPAVRALGERLARLDRFLLDTGPVRRAAADAFFHDLGRLGAAAEQGDWWVLGGLSLHRQTGAVANGRQGGLDATLARLSAEAGTDRRGLLR